MIKTVPFNHGYMTTGDHNDCVVLRRLDGSEYVEISFPFFEDMQVLRFKISEALNLRNAIDELARPLLLEERGRTF